MRCAAAYENAPNVRAEGFTEQMGDMSFQCTGGTPTPAGQAVPQYNLTLVLSSPITSRLLASNQFSEALLLVDDPNSVVFPERPLLNCGNAGAPDNGPPGAGVCSIISTGDPNTIYDGSPNGWGPGTSCDGSAGRPLANTYGCGRPNVFQARLGTPADPTQQNAITFYSVPMDAPGSGARTFRITNLRGNAAYAGPARYATYLSVISAAISIQATPPINIDNSLHVVAWVMPGLLTGPSACGGGIAGSSVRICEGFASSWRPKNVSFLVGDRNGTPGNATFVPGQYFPVYNGHANYPLDVAQNVAPALYNTESFLEFLNTGVGAAPTPNPPYGPLVVFAQNFAFNSTATGIVNAGTASFGTRIAVVFGGIPSGASVQVPATIYLFKSGSGYSGDPTAFQAGISGVMVRTKSDASGAGAFTPASAPLTSADNTAVYEVLWADSNTAEYTDVPYTLTNAPPGTTLRTEARFAPFYSTPEAGQASLTLPQPRFASTICPNIICVSASPNYLFDTIPTSLLDIAGTDPSSPVIAGGQVALRAPGIPDMVPDTTFSVSATEISATITLGSHPQGVRDVVITGPANSPIILPHAYTVLRFPQCPAYAIRYGISYPAGGASATLFVDPQPSVCNAIPTANVDWIFLSAGSVDSQGFLEVPFTIAFNPSPNSRSAVITAGKQIVTLTQSGLPNCFFGLSNTLPTAPPQGGQVSVDVHVAPGCGWSEFHQIPWVTGTTVTNNNGSGTVTYTVAPNSGADRSASAVIANQTIRIQQKRTVRASLIGTYNSGQWRMDTNGSGKFENTVDKSFFLGFPGATPFLGDWNGDGRTKAGVYSNGYWFLDYDGDGKWDGGVVDKLIPWGWTGVTPLIGDWNGDGRTKIGVYSNGFWFLDYNGDFQWDGGVVDKQVGWGWDGVTPVTGDWNGDGKTKIGVYINGFWFLDYDGDYRWDGGNVDKQIAYGWPGATPIVGDWNGDGTSKIGVFSAGNWYLNYGGDFLWSGNNIIWQLGWGGATPVLGDWNGDGKTKVGVFFNGYWYLDYYGNGSFGGHQYWIYGFGGAGDSPVVGRW
jgi:hypothetical protein